VNSPAALLNPIHLILAILAFCGPAFASVPDTLDFSSVKFARIREMLFHDPVVSVNVRNRGASSYPSAVAFHDRIVFFDKKGHEIAVKALPVSDASKITFSANGNYIYFYGPYADRRRSIHHLFRYDGKIILEREDTTRFDPNGLGFPVEGTKCLLSSRDGNVIITGFNGSTHASRQLLNGPLGEDGDIFVASSADGKMIFAVANKHKLPPLTAGPDMPILYRFNSNLDEVSHTQLPYLMAVSLRSSLDGAFLVMSVGTESGLNPTFVTHVNGHPLHMFENPMLLQFSRDCGCLVQIPHTGRPEFYTTGDWRPMEFTSRLQGRFIWMDAGISDDCRYAVLFDGDQIFLGDIAERQWHKARFPYAFSSCQLYDKGKLLILTGEFGCVIYRRVSK
jgi:hypothetical protein